MKFLRITTAIFLFLIFFVWSFRGDYSNFVNPYFPWLFIFLIFALILFSIPPLTEKFNKVFLFAEKHSYKIFPFLAFLFSLFISLSVLSGIPHVQDEINYKYLAETILNGSMSSPLHPHYEFFDFLYIIPDISGTYSIYQPGYSTLLAVFIFLKVPFLFNPLLTAGTVFLSGKISESLYNRKTAALSMFLAATSLFLMSMGGTWMAHSFCAFCTTGSVYFSVRNSKCFSIKNSLISLLFLVMLMFTRPQNALFIFIPVMIWLFFILKFSNFKKYIAVTALILIPAVLLLYYSNYIITGEMFTPKHKAFFNYTEPDDNCMGIGLHKGCHHSTIIELPDEGLTIKHAAYITHTRLVQLVYGLFFHPVIFIFIFLLFLFLNDRKNWFSDLFILSLFMITFAGYYFYYYDGNVYGPRFYYEVSFFLIILAARGMILFFEKFRNDSANPLLHPVNLFSAFFLAGLLYQFVIFAPPIYKTYETAFWGTDPRLGKILDEKGITEGVVFISPEIYYSSGAALMNLSDIDSNKLIFAHDFGTFENRRLMNYYPDKKYYRAFFNEQRLENQPPEIVPLNKEDFPDIIHLKMENKKYPVDGIPDYCNKFPAWPYIDKYSGFNIESSFTDGKTYYFCRFKNKTEFFTFGQYFENEGLYSVMINVLKTPQSAKFSFSSGSSKKVVDFFNEFDIYQTVEISMPFKKGMNFITIRPVDDP
ncbi:MAG TPA: hypothetical protein PLZ43_04850, partial [bacterium]|nr:hypothetical protein [bacterium]